MAQEKTPGVYIEEINAFPTSVVEVATAVPAFIGYTEKAMRGNEDLTNKPTRLSSLREFHDYFGGPPPTQLKMAQGAKSLNEKPLEFQDKTRFLLYYGMRLFFDNGGGPCWIVSVGKYVGEDGKTPTEITKSDLAEQLVYPTGELCKVIEPTMIVIPDAVLLSPPDWKDVSTEAFNHCVKLQSRITILDVYNGFKKRTNNDEDVVSGKPENGGFRNSIQSDLPRFAVAYYPWVNTSIVENIDVDYTRLVKPAIGELKKLVDEEADRNFRPPTDQNGAAKTENPAPGKDTSPKTSPAQGAGKANDKAVAIKAESEKMNNENATEKEVTATHQALAAVSEVYRHAMADIRTKLNLLPPSAAMAGVYTRIDNIFGVFKAPANTGIASVISPAVDISHEDQEDLNIPLDGKAINAIRTFPGRGVTIWGARTLDGNSQDWRYISVRRTMIMLEQSIKFAAEAYVFEPNSASTWVTVSHTIGNFLNNKWKEGALVGATPEEAYSVDVGLGSTMTGNDILDGYMRVTVKVAVVRPAEFIVITFQQKMQTS